MNLRGTAAVVLLLTGLSAGLPVFGTWGDGAAAGTFPGNNGLLVFDAGCVPPCEAGIATISPDGSGRQTIVSNIDLNGRLPVAPDWNADGTRVAFMAGDGSSNSGELYVADADGSDIQQLTTDLVGDGWPSWTPDGLSLIYERGQHIWRIGSEGTGAEQLNAKSGVTPSVSPGGRWIVFRGQIRQSKGLSALQLFKMRIGGTRLTRLTASLRMNSQPSWSPDGRRIVFLRGRAGSVVVMRADGTREREILEREGAGSPAFSPDGTQIAYIYRDIIKIANRDGTNTRTVENSQGAAFRVAWAAE